MRSRSPLWLLLVLLAWSTPALALDPPHDDSNAVSCADCHAYHGGDLIVFGALQEAACKSCHNPTGQAPAMVDITNHVVDGGLITLDCGSCHDPHGPHETTDVHPGGQTAANLALIRSDSSKYWPGALEPALFQQQPQHFAFDEGDTPWNGVCQTCHTQLLYHTADGSGDHAHAIGIDCLACHDHLDGFLPNSSCTTCHGTAPNSPAPPVSTTGSSDPGDVAVGAHTSHLTDGTMRTAIGCDECHIVPTDPGDTGHIDVFPAEIDWGPLATVDNPGPSWNHGTETCTNTYCHGATLAGGTNKTPVWTLVNGTQAACGTCHGNPPPPPHTGNSDCHMCHAGTVDGAGDIDVANGEHIDGLLQFAGGACDTCHGAPPASGTHMMHYSAQAGDASYGGLGATADLLPAGTAYAFDCGNCHPMDASHHMNGLDNAGGGNAEVELSPAGAPGGTLRALHDPSASYTPGGTVMVDPQGYTFTMGTCDNIYCHSRSTVTTPNPIPEPGVDFAFAGYPISYPPYTVTTTRTYSSPTWGGIMACDGCHDFTPRTFDPTVEAGAGDSHSWVDGSNFENMHGWMHGGDPCACATCHFGTVMDQGNRYRMSGLSVYDAVSITDTTVHVNGSGDVAFTPDLVTITSTPFDLSTATYDTLSQTCNDVSCHLNDTAVQWGTPFRYWNGYECNVCHQM
jgi:predicted CxxxxCH...CXXCH cytochrome family protein